MRGERLSTVLRYPDRKRPTDSDPNPSESKGAAVDRSFDELRRSQQPNGDGAANQLPGDGRPQDLPTLPQSRPVGSERVEHVSCERLAEKHVLVFGQNHDAEQERFQILCHRLRKIRQQRRLSRVLVTSAIPGEGKTVVALNLAGALACSSSRVLLVDADLRRPGIHDALGLSSSPGLADFLEGRIELAATYRRVVPLGFYYLSCGRPPAHPGELLHRPELKELMSQTITSFDWIVFDSPPLNAFADAQHLANLVDAVLLVVRDGFTPREAAEQSRAALEGAFIAGVVLNASTSTRHDYGYYTDHSASRADSEDWLKSPSGQEPKPSKT